MSLNVLRKVHIIGIDNDVTNEKRSKMLCYYEIHRNACVYIYIYEILAINQKGIPNREGSMRNYKCVNVRIWA